MPTRVKEFTQRDWKQPGVDLYRDTGDFYELSGLRPDFARRRLMRGPGWSSHITHTGLTNIRAMLHDEANDRRYIIGTNSSNYLAQGYYNAAWTFTGPTQLTTATATTGGRTTQNVVYFGGTLWVIASNGDVLTGSLTSLSTTFYSATNAVIIVPVAGRMFMLDENGDIFRQNDAGTAFESHFAPVEEYSPLYAAPFRGSLIVVGKLNDGRIKIYRLHLPQASDMYEVGEIPPESPNAPGGCSFAVYDDHLYLTPGPHPIPNGTNATDVYRFNGSQIEKVARIEDTALSPAVSGFLVWRGELVFYELLSTTTPDFRMLHGQQFVSFAPGTSISLSGITPMAEVVGGEMIVTGVDNTTQGLHRAGIADFQDGYLVTSRYDFGSPHKQKRLEAITVDLDGKATNFNIIIKYRTDDTTSWTTATTATNTRRAHIGSLGVSFYTLQVRVDLDDNSGNDYDIRINALTITYTEPEYR